MRHSAEGPYPTIASYRMARQMPSRLATPRPRRDRRRLRVPMVTVVRTRRTLRA